MLSGLAALDGEALAGYQPFHAASADLLARAGRSEDARVAYDRAIELSGNPTERAFLEGQRSRAGGWRDRVPVAGTGVV